MYNCRILVACFAIFLVSCTPDKPPPENNPPGNNPPGNNPSDPKSTIIDSISTWGILSIPGSCTPFQDYRVNIRYKFMYDTAGDITKLLVYEDAASWPETYHFEYKMLNSIKKLWAITSEKSIYNEYEDSIAVFPSNPLNEHRTDFLNIKGRVGGDEKIIRYTILNYKDSLDIVVEYGMNLSINPLYRWFHAKMKINTDGNVTDIVYFRTDPFLRTDTAIVVRNTFHTSLPNPYYSINKNSGLPFLFLLPFTNAGPFYQVTDLSQLLSKNCISHSQVKTYKNTSCGLSPGITTREFDYDLTNYFTFDGKRVTKIRDVAPEYFNKTHSGTINMNASFIFKD
jgi:hypothetical protein